MTTQHQRMPAIFFGHGNPMYAIEPNRYTGAWRSLGASIPRTTADGRDRRVCGGGDRDGGY